MSANAITASVRDTVRVSPADTDTARASPANNDTVRASPANNDTAEKGFAIYLFLDCWLSH